MARQHFRLNKQKRIIIPITSAEEAKAKLTLWLTLFVCSIGVVHAVDLRVATLNCEFLNTKKNSRQIR
jgi:hypothetical protein